MPDIIEKVLRYMVKHSKNGVFAGSPRAIMEKLDVSSGPRYERLYSLGLKRKGRGKNAEWTIPATILAKYGATK